MIALFPGVHGALNCLTAKIVRNSRCELSSTHELMATLLGALDCFPKFGSPITQTSHVHGPEKSSTVFGHPRARVINQKQQRKGKGVALLSSHTAPSFRPCAAWSSRPQSDELKWQSSEAMTGRVQHPISLLLSVTEQLRMLQPKEISNRIQQALQSPLVAGRKVCHQHPEATTEESVYKPCIATMAEERPLHPRVPPYCPHPSLHG